MRTPVILLAALVLAACGQSDRRASSAEPGASSQSSRGPDPIVLRVPRDGGRVSAYLYPNLDSTVWRSGESAPAVARALGFDVEAGRLAVVDARGVPAWIDLRLGQVRAAGKTALELPASADGTAIFGVADGRVTRRTPTGNDWAVRVGAPPEALYPQRDGSVVVAASRGGRGVVWLLRPPTEEPTDSATVPAGRPVRAGAGDRVYFASGTALVALRTRGLEAVPPVDVGGTVIAVRATPSGDRLYAAVEGARELVVVDRYAERVAARVPLPGTVRELRVDPLGRYVLARAAGGDSAWVVDVAGDRVLGTAATAWRDDLPLVLPDGAIATVRGDDVVLLDGASLDARTTVAGGARDFWHVVHWNGFRPRAAGLDEPVEFRTDEPAADSLADSVAADSTAADSARADTTAVPPDTTDAIPLADPIAAPAAVRAPRPAATRIVAESAGEVVPLTRRQQARQPARPPVQPARRRGPRFTVQFASEASERAARARIARIKIRGVALRVVPATVDGRSYWRVVAGPFASRAEAERVGRAANVDYWIYEGAP